MVCSVGRVSEGTCSAEKRHFTKLHYTSRKWELLKLRSGVLDLETICKSHAHYFGELYSFSQKKCCNPLNLHKVIRRKQLISITPEQHDQFHGHVKEVFEGRKLCIQCLRAVKEAAVESSKSIPSNKILSTGMSKVGIHIISMILILTFSSIGAEMGCRPTKDVDDVGINFLKHCDDECKNDPSDSESVCSNFEENLQKLNSERSNYFFYVFLNVHRRFRNT